MTKKHVTRRHFLNRSARGAAGLAVGAAAQPAAGAEVAKLTSARSAERAPGANDRLNVGIIGCGSRGAGSHMKDLHRLAEAHNLQIAAVCDVWKPARQRAAAAVKEWFRITPFETSDYEELLARPEIDAVTIATPDFAHTPILIAAVRAGKDAFCEKPMANRVPDAVEALKLVRERRRVVQIGTQRRSSAGFMSQAAFVQSGALGRITKVDLCWHDANPRWQRSYADVKASDVDWRRFLMDLPHRPFDPRRYRCWHLYKDYTIGISGLLGSHKIDLVSWYLGVGCPKSAMAHGGIYFWNDGREHEDTLDCLFEYQGKDGAFLVNYSTRLANSYRANRDVWYGTRGTMVDGKPTAEGRTAYGCPKCGPKQALKEKEGNWSCRSCGTEIVYDYRLPSRTGVGHMQSFVECVRSRKDPTAPIETGYYHSIASIMASYSMWQGKRMVYDPQKTEIRPG